MKKLLMLLPILTLVGCGTMTGMSLRTEETKYLFTEYPTVYPAVQFDCEVYGWIFNHRETSDPTSIDKGLHNSILFCTCAFICNTIDFPISIVTDTVCLPYDGYRLATYEEQPKPNYNQVEIIEEVK